MVLGKVNKTIFFEQTKRINMQRVSIKQNIQDWFTQQWVITCGNKFDPSVSPWLIGPFGQVGDTGEDFIHQLAQQEQLLLKRNCTDAGLLSSFKILGLSQEEESKIAPAIIDFYEKTSAYNLTLTLRWNPFFKGFGHLVNLLFSNRLNQLHIPINNQLRNAPITSEIIQLIAPDTKEVRYTFWLRTLPSTGIIIFSGVYGACQLPSGKQAVKAVFPLPNGNATVLMEPQVSAQGEFILHSGGKKWGDAGFYFLLRDTHKNYWSHFIPSFKDKLVVQTHSDGLTANQQLKLWGLTVLTISYCITPKT